MGELRVISKKRDFSVVLPNSFEITKFAISFFLTLSCLFSGCALMDRSQGNNRPNPPYAGHENQYRGIFHVHTVYSGDSKIRLKDITAAARKGRLDFVIVTDHNTIDASQAYRRSSLPAPPLMIFGVENTTPDGHLITLGPEETPPRGSSPEAILEWVHGKGGFGILAHPVSKTPWKNPDTRKADGVEVYNFAHSLLESNRMALGGKLGVLSRKKFLRNFQKRPEELLDYWDRKLESGKYAGWGAVDAHIRHKWLGWPFENELLQFESVTMFALAEKLETKPILEALAQGKSFMAFEGRGPAAGFSFTAQAGDVLSGSGDTVLLNARPVFLIKTPERATIRLVRHGAIVFEYEGREAAYPVERAGAYRVEAYRDGGLWILSNPIYIE